jgi:hypothetical protein
MDAAACPQAFPIRGPRHARIAIALNGGLAVRWKSGTRRASTGKNKTIVRKNEI